MYNATPGGKNFKLAIVFQNLIEDEYLKHQNNLQEYYFIRAFPEKNTIFVWFGAGHKVQIVSLCMESKVQLYG